MAKLPAVLHTPRRSSLRPAPAAAGRTSSDPPTLLAPTSIPRADLSSCSSKAAAVACTNCSSVGSSSSSITRDLASIPKEASKLLVYDDGFAFPAAAATAPPPELAPLLDLPDPDDAASSSTVVSASLAASMAASADFTVTKAADSEQAPPFPLTEMELVLAELRGTRGLTPRRKRLVSALVEAAAAELDPNPTAAALRLRRAAFWRKLRVGVLAAAVFSLAAMDLALAAALFAGLRGNSGHYQYDGLVPT